jgi:hypothetical protein
MWGREIRRDQTIRTGDLIMCTNDTQKADYVADLKVQLACEHGHRPGFWMAADRSGGEFSSGEHIWRVPKDSYAYTHGGCCYRAAQDALHRHEPPTS